jgi:hypothetical protein
LRRDMVTFAAPALGQSVTSRRLARTPVRARAADDRQRQERQGRHKLLWVSHDPPLSRMQAAPGGASSFPSEWKSPRALAATATR